ncbi:toxin VasX [Aliikangiella sp. IMCC44359]|uniref:toxin VasX n=1 Tax=Aliikangiella sp. IMCC44359 TaxID=3459125 RepID=UPI00403B3480
MSTYKVSKHIGEEVNDENTTCVSFKPLKIKLHFLSYGLISKDANTYGSPESKDGSYSLYEYKNTIKSDWDSLYENYSKPENELSLSNFSFFPTALNKGYLYIIDRSLDDEVRQEFYVTSKAKLIKIDWADSRNQSEDIKQGNGKYKNIRVYYPEKNENKIETLEYYEAENGVTVWIAFSKVQWSAKYYEKMHTDLGFRESRMEKTTIKAKKGSCCEKNENLNVKYIDELAIFNSFYPNEKFIDLLCDYSKEKCKYDDWRVKLKPIANNRENNHNNVLGDLFFILDDPIGCADRITDEISYQCAFLMATIKSLSTGEQPLSEHSVSKEKEKQLSSLHQTAVLTYKFIYSDFENRRHHFGEGIEGSIKAIESAVLDAKKNPFLAGHHLAVGSLEFLKNYKYRDGVNLEFLKKILAVDERASIKERINSLRNDLSSLLQSEYYQRCYEDYLDNIASNQLKGKCFFSEHIYALSRYPNDFDRMLEVPESYKPEKDECLRLLASMEEHGNIFNTSMSVFKQNIDWDELTDNDERLFSALNIEQKEHDFADFMQKSTVKRLSKFFRKSFEAALSYMRVSKTINIESLSCIKSGTKYRLKVKRVDIKSLFEARSGNTIKPVYFKGSKSKFTVVNRKGNVSGRKKFDNGVAFFDSPLDDLAPFIKEQSLKDMKEGSKISKNDTMLSIVLEQRSGSKAEKLLAGLLNSGVFMGFELGMEVASLTEYIKKSSQRSGVHAEDELKFILASIKVTNDSLHLIKKLGAPEKILSKRLLSKFSVAGSIATASGFIIDCFKYYNASNVDAAVLSGIAAAAAIGEVLLTISGTITSGPFVILNAIMIVTGLLIAYLQLTDFESYFTTFPIRKELFFVKKTFPYSCVNDAYNNMEIMAKNNLDNTFRGAYVELSDFLMPATLLIKPIINSDDIYSHPTYPGASDYIGYTSTFEVTLVSSYLIGATFHQEEASKVEYFEHKISGKEKPILLGVGGSRMIEMNDYSVLFSNGIKLEMYGYICREGEMPVEIKRPFQFVEKKVREKSYCRFIVNPYLFREDEKVYIENKDKNRKNKFVVLARIVFPDSNNMQTIPLSYKSKGSNSERRFIIAVSDFLNKKDELFFQNIKKGVQWPQKKYQSTPCVGDDFPNKFFNS